MKMRKELKKDEKLNDKTNKDNNIYFEINDELSDFNNDSTERPIQQISKSNISRQKSTDRRQQGHENKIQMEFMDESAKIPNFFQGNK